MRFRLFALVVFIFVALLFAQSTNAQSRGNSTSAHDAHNKDKAHRGDAPIRVPEPATIVLLGAAAAGAYGVRKMRQRRRSRPSAHDHL